MGSGPQPAGISCLHLARKLRSAWVPAAMGCSLRLLCLLPCLAQVGAQCSLSRHVLHVEKEGCDFCLTINTTICAGFCMSQDVNIKTLLPKMALTQRVCTYREIEYISIRLPGCPANIDPIYRFPVVLSCVCSQCLTDTTDCTSGIEAPFYCTKPQWNIPSSRSPILSLSAPDSPSKIGEVP
ncbi:thyrotropin subunit beta-like isoform X2 [Hypanus sabinus]|uniref:thyrotropin subunit beta-like isoform X2 n=1 Tax=Hypanus sabinus TaxID=79690 RepID=UPI0028C409AD|nr:thyrotropin subunit beta-like isoform X2 [Hypanus sabinus]